MSDIAVMVITAYGPTESVPGPGKAPDLSPIEHVWNMVETSSETHWSLDLRQMENIIT